MKKYLRVSLAIVAILLMSALPGQAEHYRGGGGHGGGGHGWGPGWGPVLGLGIGLGILGLTYPYYSAPAPYYPDYAPAPVMVPSTDELYLQPEPQQPASTNYWYYCQDPEGYYPYVKQCPDGWMKVVPGPPAQ